jgi:hypothetical protein
MSPLRPRAKSKIASAENTNIVLLLNKETHGAESLEHAALVTITFLRTIPLGGRLPQKVIMGLCASAAIWALVRLAWKNRQRPRNGLS